MTIEAVHDLGGTDVPGPIAPLPNESALHHLWEYRVANVMRLISARVFSYREFSYTIEQMPAPDYLAVRSYYERWLYALEHVVDRPPLARPDGPRDAPPPRASLVARWSCGARVQVNSSHPPGHNRLPHYVRGKVGTVDYVSGPYLLCDLDAAGNQPPWSWQPVYTVTFAAVDLWGTSAHPGDAVSADLSEGYLADAASA